jgi:hypothetical protein
VTQIFIPGALVTSRDGFVGTVVEQSRRGSVLCQWLNSVADDDLSHLRGFAAADLASCGGGEWLDRREPLPLHCTVAASAERVALASRTCPFGVAGRCG